MTKNAVESRSAIPTCLNFGMASLLFLFSCISLTAQDLKSGKNSILQNKIDYGQFLSQHDLVWEELPLQWNEGAFTGNAHLGMMVFASLKENRIDFHIGRQDVTDHRKAPDKKSSIGTPGAGVMYDFPRLDLGRLVLHPAGKIISGTMRVDLWNAEIRAKIITSLGEVSFRAFAPYQEMVQIIEVNSTEKEQGKKVPYQWKFLPGNPSSPRAIVFPDNKESKEYIPNPKPVLTKEYKINLCVQSLIAGGDYATAWTEKKGTKTGQSTLYITTANEVPAVGISKEVAVKNINKSVSQDIAQIEQSHRNSWHQFYSKSFLSIPDVQMESFYWIQLYKMGTCSRPDGPAVDLNGPYFRVTQWPGLWWNLNVQLTYWLVYESNHLEMGENLITLIDECFETLLARFRGPKLGDLAWAMHNYWLHFSYAGDRIAIQEKWVPKARKIAALYEEMQQKDPSGNIGLLPMESPEYKGFALYTNSSYNLAIYRWLLSTLIESASKIEANSQEVAKWKHTLSNLVPFSVDQNGIRIGSDQAVDMSHRHYSHLLGLYPLFQLNPDSPEDRALVDKSVVHWHKIGDGKGLAGYSYTGAASLYAALGRGNDAESILHHFLTGSIGISQLLSNTFYVESGGKNPVIETPLSAASSIMELLLQSWGNKIRIFPAVPDRWKNASFNDLRARGGFLVSASRTNGETDWVQIKSLAGERCIVKIPGWTNAFQAVKGKKYEIASLGNNEFKINLAAGDVILLAPSAAPVKAIVQPVKHLTEEINLYGVKKGKQLPNNQNWPEPDGYAQSIFVSPLGNDKNPGTKEKPLASFQQAQKLVRKIPTDQTVEVIFANGIYYLPQTVKFTSDDNRKSFVWKAEEEGKAILSGGSLLKLTWKPFINGIFVASVSGNPVIDQLYINGTRQRMARFPNAISGKNVFDTWDLSHQAKPDPANDPLTPERIARWNNPEGGYIHAMHSALWGDMHWIIKGKNADGTLNDEGGWQNNRPSKMHPVYRMVENIYEELDAPGEWFFNAKEQKLYYMPETGLDLSIAKVEIVRLKHLIELNGSKEAAVKNVHFKGFVFRHTTRTFMDNKEPLLRSDWTVYRGGAVVFNGAEDCSITDCEFDQVGGNTVFVNNYNRRITIRGCYIHHSGANGIAFVGDPATVRSPLFRYGKQDYSTIDRTPGPNGDNFPEDCLAEDCLITMTGRDEKQTAPVHISMSHKIRVNHCSIYDVPRAGININEGTFGGHIIENCDVFNTVLETGDHGSFNSWGRDRFWTPDINETIPEVAKDPGLPLLDMLEPNIIRNSRWRCDHGWDIDLDDGSTNYRIYNNLLLNGGLKMREGYYRTATNNIIINNGLHPHVWYLNSGDVFKNNIIFKAYQPAIMNKSIPGNGKWGKELDYNFYVSTKEVMNKFSINGCDINSLNGDPIFIDPTNGDFRASENSPALKTGFVNFPMDMFGVTKPSLKAIAKKAEIPPFTIKLDVQQPKAIFPGLSQTTKTFKLPPMPQKEEQHLGFIADPGTVEEVKMDFPMAPGKMAPTWESINAGYEKAPDWWRDAKFGIFIHWGPQASGMSGDWYARNIYREETDAYKNHLVNFGHPSEVGYKDVLNKWKPTDWNPEKLVNAYFDAGFRYALIVGVHHDNYDLWNSKYQPWNSVSVGPKKDFLAGWKKELQKKGMRFGVSFHHEYTWWWWQRAFGADKTGPKAGVPYDAAKLTLADGEGKWWKGLDPQRLYGKPMAYENLTFDGKPYILEDIAFGRKGIFGNDLAYAKWHATQWAMRIEDVIDNYDPDFIYTDGNSTQPFSGDRSASGYKSDAAQRVIAHFYNKAASRNNGKIDKLAVIKFSPAQRGVATTFEGSFPKGIKSDQPWMADRAVGDWFYRPGFVYDAGAVVHTLLEDVSRDGNLTLCVSLTPQGGMDEGSAQMLKEIGAWMKINGEGIYGSKAWKVYGEGEMVKDSKNPNAPEKLKGMPGGKLDRPHADFKFTTKDFRFTEGKDGSVYVWCMTVPMPEEMIRIKSLGSTSGLFDRKIENITVLGTTQKVEWKQEKEALVITCPEKMDFKHVVCFKITIK